MMRRLSLVVAVLLVFAFGCGGDDSDGGGDDPTTRTFDDAGFDQNGCNRDELYDPDSGLCEPGECLTEAHERMDQAGDDVEAYNQAVEDANACEEEEGG